MTRGSMRAHVEDVADDVKRAMAEFLSGRKLGGTAGADARAMPNRCSSDRRIGDLSAGASWNGWSPDSTNARFQKAGGLAPDAVPRLKLKWAFGFPGATSMYGQPTVAGGRVFIGVDTGYVYSLDAATGCVHWSFQAETGVRNAISVGPVDAPGAREAVYFGDIRGNVYSLDAATGDLLWKIIADTHPLAAITGTPTLHAGRLYVPVSSREEAAGGSLNYPCCTFRGSVLALDASTGQVIWKTYTISEPATRGRKNSIGTQLWTGAGAAVWHAPTIDLTRRAVYIATGDAYTEPAPTTTDAVMALDMDTGKVLWAVQDTEHDAWLVGCAQDRSENCPKDLGPDFDFGAPPILHALPDGRRLLLAGQKSGQVFAHDPDRQGARVWTATLVKKIGEAEILFGGAADERAAYFGLDNGVLVAVDIATGTQRWSTSVTNNFSPPRADCGADSHSGRRVLRWAGRHVARVLDRHRERDLGLQHAPGLHDSERYRGQGWSDGSARANCCRRHALCRVGISGTRKRHTRERAPRVHCAVTETPNLQPQLPKSPSWELEVGSWELTRILSRK